MDHSKKFIFLKKSDFQITCLEYSNDGLYLGVGMKDGFIHVYETDNLTLKNKFHWHCFMIEGLFFDIMSSNYLYSIGHEGVLVQWEISTKCTRFLPRISNVPFKYLIGSNSKLLLVDNLNEIIYIDVHSQNISFCSTMYQNINQNFIGLGFCQALNSLVFNSRWGMLDFYSPSLNKIVYSLSIIQKNIVTINETIIINVTNVCFLHSGNIMVTVEQPKFQRKILNYDKNLSFIKLKWWRFNNINNEFILQQTFDHSHFDFISSLSSNVLSSNISHSFVVSTSFDSNICVWNSFDNFSNWKCYLTLNFKNFIPFYSTFSKTLKLLAVSMETVIKKCIINK